MTPAEFKSTAQNQAHSVELIKRLLTESEMARQQARAAMAPWNEGTTGDGIPYFKLGRSVRYRMFKVLAREDASPRNSTTKIGGGR